MPPHPPVDDLRRLAPQVLGALVRRYGHFDACEDAVQEALLAASTQWPADGVPTNPRGWLITVASRRLIDELRRDDARRAREERQAALDPAADRPAPAPDAGDDHDGVDDTLTLLLLCCHPALSAPSQIALTLRAVGGLSTAEIAGAFLVPEATMAQRISRAKASIQAAGSTFEPPSGSARTDALRAVLHVLYLVFNEGYTTSAGPDLQRADLTAEAIRLARLLHRLLPDDGEVTGLLALMLLTDARRAARAQPDGALVPLPEQDRSRWDRALVAEGVALISAALPVGPVGPFQVQAAIAAVHDEAETAEATDWLQVLALYDVLDRIAPNPMVRLNRAVALGMVRGAAAGLAALDDLGDGGRLADHHRRHAVRAHLLELAGDLDGAAAAYREAARRTTSLPEQRHLHGRAARLADDAAG